MTSTLRMVLGVVVMWSTVAARVASAQEYEPPEGPRDRVLLCESRNYRYAYCVSPTPIEQVELTRVVSGSSCVQGRTWGFDRTGVWVDQGCRAYFRLITTATSPNTVVNIPCSSQDYRFAQCDTGLNVVSVVLAIRHSNSACIEGQTWGVQGNTIWVSSGCRATFTVTGTRR